MSTAIVPANMDEALKMLESAAGFLADVPAADLPAEVLAEGRAGPRGALRGVRLPGRRAGAGRAGTRRGGGGRGCWDEAGQGNHGPF